MLGLRAAARPAGEPAAEHERDPGVVEHPARPLHRSEQLLELLILLVCHRRPVSRRGATWNIRTWSDRRSRGRARLARRRASRIADSFAQVESEVDLVLLAGDLTRRASREQAEVLADAAARPARPGLSRCSATTTSTADRGDEIAAVLSDGGRAHARPALGDLRARRQRGRHRRHEGIRRRVHRLAAAGLRRAAAAKGLRGDDRRGRGDPARPAGGRALSRSGSSCCTTRRPRTRCTASPKESGRSSAATGSPRRSRSTAPTSSCTATRTRAASRARSETVPVYNVAVHVTGRDFYVFDLEGHEVEVETRA